jgi:DNA (cytosine-5)-methyltransferase 1
MDIPVISLFCGCGGFDLGFVKAGFSVSLALDVDPAAVRSYNRNHGEGIAIECDLSVTSGAKIVSILEKKSLFTTPRGVVGGSPCQTFSNGNVHFKSNDARHFLPQRYAVILKRLNAEYDLEFFVFENVRGINSKKHRETFSDFKALFEAAGFRLFEGLLDAVDFGVAQYRPRVFVVGLNEKKYPKETFSFPIKSSEERRTVASVIQGLPDPVFYARDLSSRDISHHPNHWTMQPKSEKFRDGFLKEGQCRGRSFRVLAWNKPSWTVAYGNREVHVHPSGKQRLSVYEAMRLQGLPITHQLLGTLSEQFRQVSDTVPHQVGKALSQQIRLFLERKAISKT